MSELAEQKTLAMVRALDGAGILALLPGPVRANEPAGRQHARDVIETLRSLGYAVVRMRPYDTEGEHDVRPV